MAIQVSFPRVVVFIAALKLLLIPSYRSTDFEVHRNWLAITASLPIDQWYLEERSQWTVDYPPLFAWFEYCLGKIAYFFDSEMLKVENLLYASPHTILFQRLSVILTDFILIGSVWYTAKTAKLSSKDQSILFVLVVLNPGLLMVDHMHFQYNGFLLGVLLWSVLCIEKHQCLLAAILFSVLLNLKHLFLYSAPVYFTYLLKHYCFDGPRNPVIGLCKLGFCVGFVFLCSFGPFIWYGQLLQVLSRMFPFGRGLCHAYWAPNAWAFYSFLDKIFSVLWRSNSPSNTTGGLVGNWSFAILPEITPTVSLLLVFLFVALPAILQFIQPSSKHFLECVAYSNLCGFMWGFHVHEKAILPILIPLILVAFRQSEGSIMNHRDCFGFFSMVGHYSLTPLLFHRREYPIKMLLLVSYAFLVHILQKESKQEEDTRHFSSFQKLEGYGKTAWMCAVCLLEAVQISSSVSGIKTKYEFLPLMMTSVLCAMGIVYYWIKWTVAFVSVLFDTQHPPLSRKNK